MSDSPVESESHGGLGELLSGDRTKVADIKLLARAAREGWNVPKDALQEAGPLLLDIARQTTTTITDDEGKPIEVSNARNQIAAVRALAELDKVNQTDFWNADKNARLDEGKATENVQYSTPAVNVLPLPPHLAPKELPPPKAG